MEVEYLVVQAENGWRVYRGDGTYMTYDSENDARHSACHLAEYARLMRKIGDKTQS
mgnify:CR=1 FL=1